MLYSAVWLSITLLVILALTFVNLSCYWLAPNLDQNQPFECGFDPMIKFRTPLSVNFYLIGILFLIFDVELVVFLPAIYFNLSVNSWTIVWFVLVFFLQIGLLVEVFWGSLDWKEMILK